MPDLVYFAACARDTRFTGVQLTRVRRFCPELTIRLLLPKITWAKYRNAGREFIYSKAADKSLPKALDYGFLVRIVSIAPSGSGGGCILSKGWLT